MKEASSEETQYKIKNIHNKINYKFEYINKILKCRNPFNLKKLTE